MKKTKWLGAVLLLSMFATQSFAGAEGSGGGAGICRNGKCITLAEAGFRVNTNSGSTEISSEAIEELVKINSLLPKQIKLDIESIIGKPGDIVFVEVADRKKLKKFSKQYSELLRTNGSSGYSENLEVLGFTTTRDGERYTKITYLIKDKVEALNPRSQALLLIHESSLRTKVASLEEALAFDGALVDYLQAIEAGKEPNLVKLLMGFKLVHDHHPNIDNLLLAQMFKSVGLPYLALTDVKTSGIGFELSYKDLLLLKKDVPTITDYIKPKTIFVERSVSRSELLLKLIHQIRERILESQSSVQLTNDDLNSMFRNHSDKDAVRASSNCGDVNDSTTIVVSSKSSPLSELVLSQCNVHTPEYGFTAYFSPESHFLKAGLNGLSFNIQAPIECTLITKNEVDCKQLNK